MTAHFLGGCVIGDSPDSGVVDAYHRMYGHPGSARRRWLGRLGEPGRQPGADDHRPGGAGDGPVAEQGRERPPAPARRRLPAGRARGAAEPGRTIIRARGAEAADCRGALTAEHSPLQGGPCPEEAAMTTSAGSQAIAGPRLLGPRITRRLLDRLAARAVTAGPRELLPVEMPATGTILGHVPRGTADDVAAAAEAARRAQRDWRRAARHAAVAGAAALRDAPARPAGRGARSDPAGKRQGPPARLRGGHRHRAGEPLLRPDRPALPAAPPARRGPPGPDPDLGVSPPEGCRRRDLAVELPADARHQ